ncbi:MULTISPECIES: sensor domain-containing protein [unclassified Mycobacterium]|uniref:sensor domain-containing protein n=1 Tax=unclassified Mycobacterium TaxID=2642494 RepID=UPI000B07E7FD|nr:MULTISPECIES: sensor domain-containing protein [unclassified Mycobacterium]
MRQFWVTFCLLAMGVVAACTRVVDSPQPTAELPVAPIAAGQVGKLLSSKVAKADGNLFVSVEPQDCAGVAREVDPPFIVDHHPAAYDGGHWYVDQPETYIEEMVGVYRADFDAGAALAAARQSIESCRGKTFLVTSMSEREYAFELLPPMESESPEILLWSFKGDDWACDSAFVAAHNAAVEISTCGPANGYDVRSLAEEALKRIDTLANMTA